MYRAGLLLILAAPLAPAAPLPRTEAETIRRLYGTPVDPDSVCTFTLDGTLLRLTAAGGLRGLNPGRGLTNAPRTLKPVAGDFTATLRMTRDAVADGTGPDSSEYTPSGGGGLLLWVDAGTHLRLSRSQWVGQTGAVPPTTYNLRGVNGQTDVPARQQNLAERDTAPVTFRLSRTGTTIAAAYSRDGKTWQTFPAVEMTLPDVVNIGVYAAHNFDKPLDVVFEPPAITKPGKKE